MLGLGLPNYGATATGARGGAGRGVHAQPTQRKYVKAEQHREPWAPAFKLLMIGMLVFGSLLSLKLHHDFQARAPTPSVAVTAKLTQAQKDALIAAAAKVTKRVAKDLFEKAKKKGQESGACSVMGDLGLGTTTGCTATLRTPCAPGVFSGVCKVMKALHTKEVRATVKTTKTSVALNVVPNRADFALCLAENPVKCEGQYKILSLGLSELSFRARYIPASAGVDENAELKIATTGDVAVLNGAIKIVGQQLKLTMDSNGVDLEAVQGKQKLTPLANWVSTLKIIHMFNPALMGAFSVVPPGIKNFGVQTGLCIGSEENCKNANLFAAIRFYTKVEMLGTVKTGLTPRFTMELVNNMNLRRIMRSFLPTKLGKALARIMGPVGAIGLKDAKGVLFWDPKQKYFTASFQGVPTGLSGACDKKNPFASVVGCLMKLLKKEAPKPFLVTYSSRTGALGVEQLTTNRRSLREMYVENRKPRNLQEAGFDQVLHIKITKSVAINRLSVFVNYEGGLGQSIRAGAKLGLAICTQDDADCSPGQKTGQLFFLGQGSVVYDVATTTAALGVQLEMQGWWWKIGFRGMLKGLLPVLPSPRIPFLHVGDATVQADIGFNIAAAAVGGVVPLLRTFALEASMCLGHMCDCARAVEESRVVKSGEVVSGCASGKNNATADDDGHLQTHNYVLGSAALSVSFTNPDQISFAAYVKKLSLTTTMKAIGVQSEKTGTFRSLWNLVEPVWPKGMDGSFTDARVSYSLLGGQVGSTFIPAGFAIQGAMSLQLGDTLMEGHATFAVGLGSFVIAAQLPKFHIGKYFKLCKDAGCQSTAGPRFYLQVGKTAMDPASMGSDHCKKDDLFCLEMDGYVEVPSLGLSASANIMVGRSGFHMAATAALGTGVMWATEIDWGANLKDGFKFVGSVEGDYIVAISEMLFSSFSGDSGLSEEEMNEGSGFMKGQFLGGAKEKIMEGVMATVRDIFSIKKIKMEGAMALMSLSAACELTYNAMDQVRTLRFAFDANSAANIGASAVKALMGKVKQLLSDIFKEWTDKQKVKAQIFQQNMKDRKQALADAYEARRAKKKEKRQEKAAALKSLFKGRGLKVVDDVAAADGYGYGSLEDLLAQLVASSNGTINMTGMNLSSIMAPASGDGYSDDINSNYTVLSELEMLRQVYGADFNSSAPTSNPTPAPSGAPSASPTVNPTTANPTDAPTAIPTVSPTGNPTTNTQKLSRDLDQGLIDTLIIWGPIKWVVLTALFVLGIVYFYSAYGGFWGIKIYVEVQATGKVVTMRVGKKITVGTLKAKILKTQLLREKGEQYAWPQEQMLTKGKMTLKDSVTLADYDIMHGDKLVLETEQSKLDDYGSTGRTEPFPRYRNDGPEPAAAAAPAPVAGPMQVLDVPDGQRVYL